MHKTFRTPLFIVAILLLFLAGTAVSAMFAELLRRLFGG